MTSTPSDFRRAIASYGFPNSEPIFYIDLNSRTPNDPSPANTPCLFVFRPGGPEAEWHQTVEVFWASALFNFLEDRLDDHRFEELGETGEYRMLSDDESDRVLGELLGTASCKYIDVPIAPTSCFLVYDTLNLKAVVGTDSDGFFAIMSDV